MDKQYIAIFLMAAALTLVFATAYANQESVNHIEWVKK